MANEKERFEILLEEVRDGVKLVAEGHGTIRSEMRQMEERLTEKIEENNGAIKWVAKDLGRKIEEVKDELKEVKEKVDKIDHTLEEHVRLPAHAVV